MQHYFINLLQTINSSINSLDYSAFGRLLGSCVAAEQRGGKVIATGLGKNVPICEKYVGTMLSLGLNAGFMHTNTAIHGDLGLVRDGDVILILTKSGRTAESVYLYEMLKKRDVEIWLLTFGENCPLSMEASNKLVLRLDHEGDAWDVVPNNSTTIYLIILQALAIQTAERTGVTLSQFAFNHPGGSIGELLRNE